MNIIFAICLISFSYEQTCSFSTFGYCNDISITKQCHKFGSNCESVEIDTGCQIDVTSHECKNTGCYNYGSRNTCLKITTSSGCKITMDQYEPKCEADGELSSTEKCLFMSKTNCLKVNVDAKCAINSQGNCVDGTGIEAYEQCQFVGSTECKPVNLQCASIKDTTKCNTCKSLTLGYLGYECLKAGSVCKEFKVDSSCAINSNDGTCQKDSGVTDTTKVCRFSDPAVKSICSLYTVESKCKIDDNAMCIDGTGNNAPSVGKICGFEADLRTCKEQDVVCSVITSQEICEAKIVEANKKKCSWDAGESGTYKCKEYQINKYCTVNNGKCENGSTAIPSPEAGERTKFCLFSLTDELKCEPREKECNDYTDSTSCEGQIIETNSKMCSWDSGTCKEYKVNEYCKVSGGKCVNGNTPISEPESGAQPKFCLFGLADQLECTPRERLICADYPQADCNAANLGTTTKCLWDSTESICKQYIIDGLCTVTNEGCVLSGTSPSPDDGKECLFGITNKLECKRREKVCEDISTNCETTFPLSEDSTAVSQCILSNSKCINMPVDQQCKYDTTNKKCVFRKSNIAQSVGICDFNDEETKSSCVLRTRKCTEYTDNTCNSLSNCAYHGDNKCYTTDDQCTFDSADNYKCKPKNADSFSVSKKCVFSGETYNVCKAVDKECSEFDNTSGKECSHFARTSTEQCYKFSTGDNSRTCHIISLDGYCYVDNSGNCVTTSGTTLQPGEKCEFNNDKTQCKKKLYTCGDIKDDTCNAHTYVEKKECYIIDNLCKELQIDNGCSVDKSTGLCEGTSCTFDTDKTGCYRKESKSNGQGQYIKFTQIIIFVLLFLL